jgi:hypothetical protein
MHSDRLVKVHTFKEIQGEFGIVMDYVPGKSLAEICRRAEERSLLLPTELGVVVAYDAFKAIGHFHDFEDANRVHGNISLRTLLVGYSGEVKVAGFRPGFHSCAEMSELVNRDLKPLANILYEMEFQKFPKALVRLVPCLLEDTTAPAEASAFARAYVQTHVPSKADRQKVADWLAEVFPGECDKEARENGTLYASGIEMIGLGVTEVRGAKSTPFAGVESGGDDKVGVQREEPSTEFHRTRFKVLAIAAIVSLILGTATWLLSHRSGRAVPEAKMGIPTAQTVQADLLPEAGSPIVDASFDATLDTSEPIDSASVVPAAIPDDQRPPDAAPDGRPGKRKNGKRTLPDPATVEQLIQSADAAFDRGNRIEAVKFGTQALNAGGGVRAHLALAGYYQSMRLYREALRHYRAAIRMDPGNRLAAKGIEMVEKHIPPRP